jgi:hypothetical protein
MLTRPGPSRLGAIASSSKIGLSRYPSTSTSLFSEIYFHRISLQSALRQDSRVLYAAALKPTYRSLLTSSHTLHPTLAYTQLRLRQASIPLRQISTEPHRPTTTTPPPPPIASDSSLLSKADNKLSTVPPLGHPPPSPPVKLSSIPPKITEVAAEKAEQEVAKKEEKVKGTFPQRAWATVKKEASHYWHGTKLLGQEIKISAKLQWKVLNGGTLTRRERRQVGSI